MNLQQQLQLKLSSSSLHDISQLMNYRGKTNIHKAALRIDNVLSDPQLGLTSGKYDFKYSNEEFLAALCAVVGININEYHKELNTITNTGNGSSKQFKPYIFIDTNFQRDSQPIFILAFCEGQRYIQLDSEVLNLPVNEQVGYVQALVKQHFIDCEGNVKIWGDIQRYVFFYAEGCKLALSPEGVILGEPEVVNISCAAVTVSGVGTHALLSNRK